MTANKPEKVYFFNDTNLIGCVKRDPTLIKNIRQKFYDISKYIVSDELNVIDYESCLAGLRSRLKFQKLNYDHVICVGEKGEALFNDISDVIEYDNLKRISIKRAFIDDTLHCLDWEFNLQGSDHEFLASLENQRVLFIDDVVYSGSTIAFLIEKTVGESHVSPVIVTLISTETAESKLGSVISGITVPGGTWPIYPQDLWCFRDLIEKDGVVCASGKSKRFIDYECIMKKWLFGNDFEKVRSSIDEISGWINS